MHVARGDTVPQARPWKTIRDTQSLTHPQACVDALRMGWMDSHQGNFTFIAQYSSTFVHNRVRTKKMKKPPETGHRSHRQSLPFPSASASFVSQVLSPEVRIAYTVATTTPIANLRTAPGNAGKFCRTVDLPVVDSPSVSVAASPVPPPVAPGVHVCRQDLALLHLRDAAVLSAPATQRY